MSLPERRRDQLAHELRLVMGRGEDWTLPEMDEAINLGRRPPERRVMRRDLAAFVKDGWLVAAEIPDRWRLS